MRVCVVETVSKQVGEFFLYKNRISYFYHHDFGMCSWCDPFVPHKQNVSGWAEEG